MAIDYTMVREGDIAVLKAKIIRVDSDDRRNPIKVALLNGAEGWVRKDEIQAVEGAAIREGDEALTPARNHVKVVHISNGQAAVKAGDGTLFVLDLSLLTRA